MQHWIEATNPKKIQAILDMQSPNLKGVQQLTSCLAALNRFLSKFAEKMLPFFPDIEGRKEFPMG